jgi:queuosine precursor transporter
MRGNHLDFYSSYVPLNTVENELLSILSALVIFFGILLFYRFFGKAGLFIWIGIAVIIANVQVLKTIAVFGFVTAMGNVIYATTYLATDILNEIYGKKEARRAVFAGFFVLIFFTIIMQLTLHFAPDASDTLSPALAQVFGLLPRVTVASLLAYVVSQFIEVSLYAHLKNAMKGKRLWLRNNLCGFLSQLLDNAVFTWIFFVGFFGLFGWEQILPWNIIIEIFFTSLVIKYVVSACDTPFLYMAVWMKKKKMIPEN